MPTRKRTTRTETADDQPAGGHRDASDPKTRARLKKLMAALGVPKTLPKSASLLATSRRSSG
jgi:hypothetical protein